MTGRAFLETARLVLRPLAEADRAACVAAMNDPDELKAELAAIEAEAIGCPSHEGQGFFMSVL